MVSDGERPGHPPFGGFRVTTERMPDGRAIHYYEWPDDERPGDPGAAGGERPPAATEVGDEGDE